MEIKIKHLFLLIVLGGIGGKLGQVMSLELGLWWLFAAVLIICLFESAVAYLSAMKGRWYAGILLHLIGAGVTLFLLLQTVDAFSGNPLVFGQPFEHHVMENGEWLDWTDSGLAWYFIFAMPIIRVAIIEPIVLWRLRKAIRS